MTSTLRRTSLLAAACLLTFPLLAQGVTVGRLAGNVYGFRPASPITLIDLAHPATTSNKSVDNWRGSSITHTRPNHSRSTTSTRPSITRIANDPLQHAGRV
jgi:hypothetical protein